MLEKGTILCRYTALNKKCKGKGKGSRPNDSCKMKKKVCTLKTAMEKDVQATFKSFLLSRLGCVRTEKLF